MKYKKILSLTIIMAMLLSFSSIAIADYVIDRSNGIITPDYTIQGTIYPVTPIQANGIDDRDIKRAIRYLDFDFDEDFTVHVVDYYFNMSSAFGVAFPETNTIILFDFLPSRVKYTTQMTVVHEIGHLVYERMSDWHKAKYKKIRGIPLEWDDTVYTEYQNRPQEIFAEDFRILFGGKDATIYIHGNEELIPATEVRGLERFIRIFED